MPLSRLFLSLLTFFITVTLSQLSLAHTEHQEIRVKSTFEVNQQKQLSSVRMVWLYDTFTSDDMLQHEKDLNRLAKTLISDIARFNYFTRLNSGDRRVVANSISNYSLSEVIDHDKNPALQLSFTLVLKSPLNINSLKKLDIVHADPTGSSIFFYYSPEDIILANELKSKCSPQLREKAEFQEGQFPQIAAIVCRA